jgi:hypothetical protein
VEPFAFVGDVNSCLDCLPKGQASAGELSLGTRKEWRIVGIRRRYSSV